MSHGCDMHLNSGHETCRECAYQFFHVRFSIPSNSLNCVMLQSSVTTAPTTPGQGGRGIAGQMCLVFTFALSMQCGGNAGYLI